MSLEAGIFPLKQKPEAYVLLVTVSCKNKCLMSDDIGAIGTISAQS